VSRISILQHGVKPANTPPPVRFATFATNAGVSPETSVDVGGCRSSRHDFVMIEFLNYEKGISDSISNSLSRRQIHEKPAIVAGFFFLISELLHVCCMAEYNSVELGRTQ
jgi:hypothetical protein